MIHHLYFHSTHFLYSIKLIALGYSLLFPKSWVPLQLMIFSFIIKIDWIDLLIELNECFKNFDLYFEKYQMIIMLENSNSYLFDSHYNHHYHHLLYPWINEHYLINSSCFRLLFACDPDYRWYLPHVIQTVNHLLNPILSKHLQALIFQLQHLLCKCIRQNSYQLFYFLLSFFNQEAYGKDLLHQTNQNFRYLFRMLFMEYMEESFI